MTVHARTQVVVLAVRRAHLLHLLLWLATALLENQGVNCGLGYDLIVSFGGTGHSGEVAGWIRSAETIVVKAWL